MASQKNSKYYIQTTKNTVPASSAGTGTVDSYAVSPNLTGTGTSFTTEAKAGWWIYIAGQSEIQKIRTVVDDTNIVLWAPFGTPLSGSSFAIVNADNIKSIKLTNLSTGAVAYIDGAAFAVGTTVDITKQTHVSSGYDFVDPVVLDASGTTVQIVILK